MRGSVSTLRPDDIPARLVRAAALQLGDKQLAARYEEEWLGSLPPRDRYWRWRYAVSLSWAERGRPAGPLVSGSRRPADPNGLPDSQDPERNVPAGGHPRGRHAPGALLPVDRARLGFSGHCLHRLVPDDRCPDLAELSYRCARWWAGCGVMLSLIQTWTGTAFLQGGGPVGASFPRPC